MNKQKIIDIGIIFVCITAILSGFVLILVINPLVMVFLSMAFMLLGISIGIYGSFKDRLPWRRNDGHGEGMMGKYHEEMMQGYLLFL